MSGRGYAADVTPQETWDALASGSGAVMVDVRTAAEWNFVGLPDLSSIGAPLLRFEWQSFPSGEIDPGFAAGVDAALKAARAGADTSVYFICRSGQRSAAAAAALTAMGYTRCFNVSGGFEGKRDEKGHRGVLEGWKAASLPWVQS